MDVLDVVEFSARKMLQIVAAESDLGDDPEESLAHQCRVILDAQELDSDAEAVSAMMDSFVVPIHQ